MRTPFPRREFLGRAALSGDGELERRERELWGWLGRCRLCPRNCGADRLAGEIGTCGLDARTKLASFGPHFGEEAPLVGRGGSGTIFFSHCDLLCAFCQNWEIAHRGNGDFVSAGELSEAMLSLQRQGCENINLVTPTHQLPQILAGLRLAIAGGLHLPLVYNTGGYDSLEAIRLLEGVVDIYMPDFKYTDPERAARYSSGAREYPEVARAVIAEMHRQVGLLQLDEHGVARRGLLIRHLVLPDDAAGTERFARWVAEELHPDTFVNIMAQYRPEHRARDFPEIARRPAPEEIARARRWAREAGLRRLVG